jgi:hypothetical protein
MITFGGVVIVVVVPVIIAVPVTTMGSLALPIARLHLCHEGAVSTAFV